VQNGAPVAIDRCTVALESGAAAGASDLSEDVAFTNVSQRTVTLVRFEFKAVGANGLIERAVTGDKTGAFAPGNGSGESLPDRDGMKQTVSALPRVTEVLCKVAMVRFDDGSVWRDGDGPAGSATMYTPGPAPSSTQWQWPYDTPRP